MGLHFSFFFLILSWKQIISKKVNSGNFFFRNGEKIGKKILRTRNVLNFQFFFLLKFNFIHRNKIANIVPIFMFLIKYNFPLITPISLDPSNDNSKNPKKSFSYVRVHIFTQVFSWFFKIDLKLFYKDIFKLSIHILFSTLAHSSLTSFSLSNNFRIITYVLTEARNRPFISPHFSLFLQPLFTGFVYQC